MTNILPFSRKMATELSTPVDVYRELTAEEALQILECLGRMEGHILVLRQELVSKQSHLAIAKWEVQQLLHALAHNQNHPDSP